jgi:acetate kinase
MKSIKNPILTINGGSSSIKFSLYEAGTPLVQLFNGGIENIGTKDTKLHFTDAGTKQQSTVNMPAGDQDAAAAFLMDWLGKQDGFAAVKAIGHRIVHGMKHTDPEKITPALLDELKQISAYDPDHLPAEIKLIEMFTKSFPGITQIACFDTSFHTSMPPVAKLLPLPRRFTDNGIQRYGFHGLSYAYLMQELKRVAGENAANGRVILAHLGSGASLAAVKDGRSMDTSMGFTPVSGIPMSTRTGDLDPGVAWYIMQSEKCSPKQFSHLINHESGLLGVSGTSSDMKTLLESRHTDKRAADAVELFCYQTKKWIGSFAAVLGGVDTLIFAGGIGERAAEIRSRICNELQFLGIELDETSNEKNEPVISIAGGRVCVRVMKTNEELMIAELVCQVMHYTIKN